MSKKNKVNIELNVREVRRISGWSENAVMEYELTHPDFSSSLTFKAMRKELPDVLAELSAGTYREPLSEDATALDVAEEVILGNTGVTMTAREKQHFQTLLHNTTDKTLSGTSKKETNTFGIKVRK